MKGIIGVLLLLSIVYVHCAPYDKSELLPVLERIQQERRLRAENPYDWRRYSNSRKQSDVVSLQEFLKSLKNRDERNSEETDGRPPIPLNLLRIKKKLESDDEDSDSEESERTSDRKKKISRRRNSNESDELKIRKRNSDESSREENSRKNKNRRGKNRDRNDSSESNLTEDSSDSNSSEKSKNKHSKRREHNSRNKTWKRDSKESDSDSDDDTDSDEEEFKKYLRKTLKKENNRQIQQMLRNGDIDGRDHSSRGEIYYNKLYKWNRDRYLEWKRKIDLKAQILSEKRNLNRERLLSICNIPDDSEDDEQDDLIRKCVKSHMATNDKFNITTDLSAIHSLSSSGKNVSKWVRVENGNDSKVVQIRVDKPLPNGDVHRINILKEIPTGLDQSNKSIIHKIINKVNSNAGIPVSDNLAPAINKASSSPEQVDDSKGPESAVDEGTTNNKDNDSVNVGITEEENDPSSNKEKSSDDSKKQTESNVGVEVEGQQKSIIPVEENVNTEITNQRGNKQGTSDSHSGILPTENEITSSKLPTGNSETSVSNNTGVSNRINDVSDNGQTNGNKTSTTSVNSTNEVPNTVQEQVEIKPEVIVAPGTPKVIPEADQASEASISKIGPSDGNANINISVDTSNVLKENKSPNSSPNLQQNSSVIDTASRNQEAASSSKAEGSNVTKVEEIENGHVATNVDDNKPSTAIETNNIQNDTKKSNGNVNEQTSSNVNNQTSSNVNDQTSSNVNEQTSSNVNEQASSNVNNQTSSNNQTSNVNEQTSNNVNEQTSSNVNEQTNSNVSSSSRNVASDSEPRNPSEGEQIEATSSRWEPTCNDIVSTAEKEEFTTDARGDVDSEESTTDASSIQADSSTIKASTLQSEETTLLSENKSSIIIGESKGLETIVVNDSSNALNNLTIAAESNNTLNNNESNSIVNDKTTSNDNKSISQDSQSPSANVSSNLTILENDDKKLKPETASHVIEEDQVTESSRLQPEVVLSDDANLLNNDAIKTELNNTVDSVSIVRGRDSNESTTSRNIERFTSLTEDCILTETEESGLQTTEISQTDSTNTSDNVVTEIENNNSSDIDRLNNISSETDISVTKSTTLRETLPTFATDGSILDSKTKIIINDENTNVSDTRNVVANNSIDDTDRLSRNESKPSDVNANQSTVLNSESEKSATDVVSIANSAAATADSQTNDSELNTPSVTVNVLTVNEDDLIYNTVVSGTVSSVPPTESPSESPEKVI